MGQHWERYQKLSDSSCRTLVKISFIPAFAHTVSGWGGSLPPGGSVKCLSHTWHNTREKKRKQKSLQRRVWLLHRKNTLAGKCLPSRGQRPFPLNHEPTGHLPSNKTLWPWAPAKDPNVFNKSTWSGSTGAQSESICVGQPSSHVPPAAGERQAHVRIQEPGVSRSPWPDLFKDFFFFLPWSETFGWVCFFSFWSSFSFFAILRWVTMPTGSVRLQSIKKLGHENQSYEFSDEGNGPFCFILGDARVHHMCPKMIESLTRHFFFSPYTFSLNFK